MQGKMEDRQRGTGTRSGLWHCEARARAQDQDHNQDAQVPEVASTSPRATAPKSVQERTRNEKHNTPPEKSLKNVTRAPLQLTAPARRHSTIERSGEDACGVCIGRYKYGYGMYVSSATVS